MTTYPVGTTNRTTGDLGPILHAATNSPRRLRHRRAAGPGPVAVYCDDDRYGTFDPEHDRACPRCAYIIRNARAPRR